MSQDLTRTRARPPRGPGPPASAATEAGGGRCLAARRPEPRAGLLDPRAPPYPDPARVARLPPPPPGASAPFKPSWPSPGRAPRPTRASPFLTQRYRRRSLPGAAPSPPRGVGDRVGVSLLLSKQRSRRRRGQARGKASRARPLSFGRPPPQHTRSPRARHTRARPRSQRPLPLPARPRARASPPFRSLCARAGARCAHARVPEAARRWAGPQAARAPGAPPLWGAGPPCTCAPLHPSHAPHAPCPTIRGACAGRAPLRGGFGVGGGDFVVLMGDSNDESEARRLGKEHPEWKVKPVNGQTASGRDRAYARPRAGLGNSWILRWRGSACFARLCPGHISCRTC